MIWPAYGVALGISVEAPAAMVRVNGVVPLSGATESHPSPVVVVVEIVTGTGLPLLEIVRVWERLLGGPGGVRIVKEQQYGLEAEIRGAADTTRETCMTFGCTSTPDKEAGGIGVIVTVPMYDPGWSLDGSGVRVSELDDPCVAAVAVSHWPPLVATEVAKSRLPVIAIVAGAGAGVPVCQLQDAVLGDA